MKRVLTDADRLREARSHVRAARKLMSEAGLGALRDSTKVLVAAEARALFGVINRLTGHVAATEEYGDELRSRRVA